MPSVLLWLPLILNVVAWILFFFFGDSAPGASFNITEKTKKNGSAPSKTDIPVGTHIEGFGGAQVDRFGAFDPIAAEVSQKGREQGFQLIVAFALRRKR